MTERCAAILKHASVLHPHAIDLSLERSTALLEHLGAPHRRLPPVLHVAGTNGKGSTMASLRALLEAAGQRVHVYTSPHLVSFRERIRLGRKGGGVLVEDAQLCAVLERCLQENAGAPLTPFELLTTAAFVLFSENPADIVLLEVGMGGRLDATNLVPAPQLCVVTPISYDHTSFLGTTLTAIAKEKAGIFKAGRPVVVAAQRAEAADVLRREAERKGAPLFFAGEDWHFTRNSDAKTWRYSDAQGTLELPLPSLIGAHQIENAALAIAALRFGGCAIPIIPEALGKISWPGRFQKLGPGPLTASQAEGSEIWVDGAHNPAGAAALATLLQEKGAPVHPILGVLNSKDVNGFLIPFRKIRDRILHGVTAVPVPGDHGSHTPEFVAEAARAAGIQSYTAQSLEEALSLHRKNWEFCVPIITGSLHLVGAALEQNGDLRNSSHVSV